MSAAPLQCCCAAVCVMRSTVGMAAPYFCAWNTEAWRRHARCAASSPCHPEPAPSARRSLPLLSAEALFDRWAASVAGEGEACVMWTTHAFLAQAASDSGLFVVERAEAKHAGLLTNVVLRPHNYSEAVCALLAALW